MHEFAETFARLAGRELRTWRIPPFAARFLIGAALADWISADAVFSNIRLRGIGFRFTYPTIDLGLQQILGAICEPQPSSAVGRCADAAAGASHEE